MDNQTHLWGALRSAIHNSRSALELSTKLHHFVDSEQEHALRYLVEHRGGSKAFWLGMSQGNHRYLSWLLPMMKTAEHIQLIDTVLHHIHFELKRGVGFQFQQLEIDVEWLLQWQLQFLDKVCPRVFDSHQNVWGLLKHLKSLSVKLHTAQHTEEHARLIDNYWNACEHYINELDRTLYAQRLELLIPQDQFDDEEPDEHGEIWPYWVGGTSAKSNARLLIEDAMRCIITAMQDISGIDNENDSSTYETTKRVGVDLSRALECVYLASQPLVHRNHQVARNKAEQEVLLDFTRFILNKYACSHGF